METNDIIALATDCLVPLVTGVVGFLNGRRKRKNDFLGDLQSSIDTLSRKNSELMKRIIGLNDTVILLRNENAELKGEVALLRKENEQLSIEVGQLREQLSGVKTITRIKKADG